jgi:DNA invertase Pin-like site-specific DNA recombinase
MKRVSHKDRLFYQKVSRRIAKGMTWDEITTELGDNRSTLYNRYQRIGNLMMREQEKQAAA